LAAKSRIREGDIVTRKSYGGDVFFQVIRVDSYTVGDAIATLKGLNMRLLADAPVSDLAVVDERELLDFKRKTVRESAEHLRAVRVRRITEEQARHRKERRRSRGGVSLAEDVFSLPGRVLHIDGDSDYLRDCNPDHMADYGSKPSESGEASVAPRPQAILLCQALVNLAWTFGCEFL
jgi:spore coat assembly protein